MAMKTCFGFISRTASYLRRSRRPEASIPALQKAWSQETLERFNIDLKIKGTVTNEAPVLFVGNHISYLDITLLINAIDDVSFVAKKELSAWPVFGPAARAMNTIFVERGSTESRQLARRSIVDGLRDKRRIVLFPSGTTCLTESKSWRQGAFEIAAETGTRVQPFRLTYTPLRHAAFIDDDLFALHIYRLAGLPKITARLEFHEPVTIRDPRRDCLYWQSWAQQIVSGRPPLEQTTLDFAHSAR
jgi:1-acyl-sn-glycerol-3-phosphate acyltransferase